MAILARYPKLDEAQYVRMRPLDFCLSGAIKFLVKVTSTMQMFYSFTFYLPLTSTFSALLTTRTCGFTTGTSEFTTTTGTSEFTTGTGGFTTGASEATVLVCHFRSAAKLYN